MLEIDEKRDEEMAYKAALYCRLSKEDEYLATGGISESIQNQKLLLKEYALKQGWEIYEIYCDEDYKGFDRGRPEFNRMIEDGEKGRFNIVLCKHQSRFTRDIELVEEYIHGKFLLWGIRFVSITDNIDTNIKGNKKTRQINSLVNEWYSEDLSENIRAVFKKKMEDGQYLAPFACYGYRKNPENKHELLIDREAANVVSHIFELYLQGYSGAKIAQILTESQVETPTQYKKRKNLNYYNPKADWDKGIWSGSTVKKILNNEVYTGTLIQGKEKKISYKSKKTVPIPKEHWVIIENNHEGIIDRERFETVKSLMKGRMKRSLENGENLANNCIYHKKAENKELELLEKEKFLLLEELGTIYKQKVAGKISIDEFMRKKEEISLRQKRLAEKQKDIL